MTDTTQNPYPIGDEGKFGYVPLIFLHNVIMMGTDKIKRGLIEFKSELEALESNSGDAGDTVVLDQAKVGRLSRMDAMQAQQMALDSTRRRQLQLQKIEGALRRLEADEYGYCFICHGEIDNRRLAIDPTSTRCMACVDK